MDKKLKVFAKPVAHLVGVAALTTWFIWANGSGRIGEHTPVSASIARAIDFAVSLSSFWTLPVALAAILIIAIDFSAFKKVRGFFYRSYLIVLGVLTGKLYTLGALYLAYSLASRRVSYLQPLEDPYIIAAISILAGLVVWFGGKAVALKLLRRRSNSSSKPTPLRGAA